MIADKHKMNLPDNRGQLMSDVTIFCKSYRNVLERAIVMAESVRRLNRDSLPFCISAPKTDMDLFKSQIGTEGATWLADEMQSPGTKPRLTPLASAMITALTRPKLCL